MKLKILSSLTNVPKERNNVLTIGTHSGIFHVDEVVACAILCLIYKSIQILRTRDSEMLMQCDICVDVGGGKFDHHQKGFDEKRENGIKYASAGLVWKEYGKQLINVMLEKYFFETKCDTEAIFKAFDNYCIVPVDREDNGEKTEKHCFSFISSYLPLWFNNTQEDFDNQFYKVLETTAEVLEQELKVTIGKEIAKNTIVDNYNNSDYYNNGILEIPSQTIDWVETVININDTQKNIVNFVIFPYPAGGWAAQCVPPSLEDKFAQRIAFPHEWAGQTNKLSEISKVDGATFCHNGRFFVRATSKEAVIKMCNIATM